MNGHTEPASVGRWWAGIFVGFVLSALGWLANVAVRHEGTLGRWDGQLETIQRSVERIENKLDHAREKK